MGKFDRGPSIYVEHMCGSILNLDKQFRRRCHLKKKFTGYIPGHQTKTNHKSKLSRTKCSGELFDVRKCKNMEAALCHRYIYCLC